MLYQFNKNGKWKKLRAHNAFICLYLCCKKKLLTCRESSSFMAFCEFNVEECDDRMHVVISSALEMEGSRELQVSFLDCVDVYFLEPKNSCICYTALCQSPSQMNKIQWLLSEAHQFASFILSKDLCSSVFIFLAHKLSLNVFKHCLV